MAQDALDHVLQAAEKQVTEHFHLVSGSDNELKLLVRDRDLLNAYLNDLGEQSTNGEILKQYQTEVRTVAYQAHDIIDECLTTAALNSSSKFPRFLRFLSPKYGDLAYKVKSFRGEIIKPLFDKYDICKIISPSPQIPHSITTKPSDLKVTSPNQESIRCPKDEASTSTKFLNEEFEHEITLEREENIVDPKGKASIPTKFHNAEITLEREENIVDSKGKASIPTKFHNEELKHEDNGRRTVIGTFKMYLSISFLEIMHKLNVVPRLRSQVTSPQESVRCPKDEASTSTKFLNEEFEHENPPRRGTVVGFKEKADTVIQSLFENSMQLEVVSIIAGPGMGKTTLAQMILKDERTKNHFQKLIWVDVSQNYDRRKMLVSILESLTQDRDTSKLADDKLALTIKLYLQNLKFCLFLDGLWNDVVWEDVEAALPKANHLGRVLLTSCCKSVAKKANFIREPYELDLMDKTTSWDLLQLQVFDNLNICPPHLVHLGIKIAHGCGGVPLAIVVIAGVLIKMCSTSTGSEQKIQWEKVSNNVSTYLNNDRTKNVIAFSCNELSRDLRECFLYLGVFPEESPISVNDLIYKWIAEGFILQKPNMSLEEVAKDNLKDLIDRNLVKVDTTKHDGSIKTCRVPSLIREFCINEGKNRNLFQEIKMSTADENFEPPCSEVENLRRLCIHSHVEVFLKKKPKGPLVHSFLCFAKDAVDSLPADTSPIPMQFSRLRVLDIRPIKLTKFPSKLTKQLHLRYMALSGEGDDFRIFPKSMSKLWNLQSITIDTELLTVEIRANIWKMPHLRNIKSKAAIILDIKSKGTGGENLQSLSRLSAKCCTANVLNRAKNLKKLGIRGNLACILEVQCLRSLCSLKTLKLFHDVYPVVASENPLPRLPDPDQFPPNLRTLQLSATNLPWSQFRVLEELPKLEVLILKNNAFAGKLWLAADGYFPNLEILVIEGSDLRHWIPKESYFPKLRCLVLKDCNELEKVPIQLAKNLERLHLERVRESAIESARIIAEVKKAAQDQRSAAERIEFKLIIGS